MPAEATRKKPSKVGTAPRRDRSPLLKEKAYAALKRAILDETYAPGTFLSEALLSAEFKMSKTPIRAALERLETEGMVVVGPQQGIVVRDLTADEIADVFELRIALESHVVARLAGRLPPLLAAEVEANLALQARAAAADDPIEYTRLDAGYHDLLLRASGNREIARVSAALRDKVFRAALRGLRRYPERMSQGHDEHRRVFDAVRRGEADTAVRLVVEHLAWGRRVLGGVA